MTRCTRSHSCRRLHHVPPVELSATRMKRKPSQHSWRWLRMRSSVMEDGTKPKHPLPGPPAALHLVELLVGPRQLGRAERVVGGSHDPPSIEVCEHRGFSQLGRYAAGGPSSDGATGSDRASDKLVPALAGPGVGTSDAGRRRGSGARSRHAGGPRVDVDAEALRPSSRAGAGGHRVRARRAQPLADDVVVVPAALEVGTAGVGVEAQV